MTQIDQILEHLKAGNSITPIDALNMFGCFRLGARIFDLRERGYLIATEYEKNNGKTYARYSLMSTP
jgi:hypothetical protein